MNLGHERVHPSDALVSFPVEDRYSIAEIAFAVMDKEFSFLARAVAAGEVVEAPTLASVDALLNPYIAVLVNKSRSLGGLAYYSIDIWEKGREVDISLPVRYVDEPNHYSITTTPNERSETLG